MIPHATESEAIMDFCGSPIPTLSFFTEHDHLFVDRYSFVNGFIAGEFVFKDKADADHWMTRLHKFVIFERVSDYKVQGFLLQPTFPELVCVGRSVELPLLHQLSEHFIFGVLDLNRIFSPEPTQHKMEWTHLWNPLYQQHFSSLLYETRVGVELVPTLDFLHITTHIDGKARPRLTLKASHVRLLLQIGVWFVPINTHGALVTSVMRGSPLRLLDLCVKACPIIHLKQHLLSRHVSRLFERRVQENIASGDVVPGSGTIALGNGMVPGIGTIASSVSHPLECECTLCALDVGLKC